MFETHSKLVRTIFIGLIVILLLLLLLIVSYVYYSRRRHRITERKPSLSNSIHPDERFEGNSPNLIEELMRKSLELAQTAEQVAEKNEQTLTVQDNIHTHL